MTEQPKNQKLRRSKKREILHISLLLIISLLFSIVLMELLLRLLSIPGIRYDISTYDELTGFKYHPNCVSIYKNSRGDFVKRKTNSYGFLDVEHLPQKESGVTRIGFFGDSFTEARQVPIESTFFHKIESSLSHYNIECLSFGLGGFGTLQSYLNSSRYSELFDLDIVIYVFFENDIVENLKERRSVSNIPFPVLTDAGFEIDTTFRTIQSQSLWWKINDRISPHSLLLSTLNLRTNLLFKYVLNNHTREKLEARGVKKQIPEVSTVKRQSDIPYILPDSLLKKAVKLYSAIAIQWKRELTEKQIFFAIICIPSGREFREESGELNVWKTWLESFYSWLESFCLNNEIEFIDPTPFLIQKDAEGVELFYDHLTIEGHQALAEYFAAWYVESKEGK